MPKVISVPGEGLVSFPDEMGDDDISRVIRLHQPEPEAKGSPGWVDWRNQRVHDLNDAATSGHQPEDKGFLRGLWETVNPFPAIGAVIAGKNPETGKYGGPMQGIQNLMEGTLRAQGQQFSQAGQDFHHGNYVSGAGHAMAGALPVVGPAAANAGEAIGEGRTGEGLGQAAGLVGAVVAPEIAARTIPKAGAVAAPGAEAALRASAEKQYAQVLAPTTKINKHLTAKVVPELIERGATAFTLKGMQEQASMHIRAVGSAIGDAWDNLPTGTTVDLEPVYDHLQRAIDETHSVKASDKAITTTPPASGLLNASGQPIQPQPVTTIKAGELIPIGPEAKRAISNISSLQQTLVDIAETDPATGKMVIPVEKIHAVRHYFDDIAARAGRYGGKDLADQSAAEAHGLAADAIRRELAKDHPDIDALNKEYTLWKNVHQIVSDTLLRKQGQSRPLGVQLARAGGFVKAGPLGAEGMGMLTEAVRSPAWRTISAVTKDRLADAIASGNSTTADFYIGKIGQGLGAAALSDRESQMPQLVGAPEQ